MGMNWGGRERERPRTIEIHALTEPSRRFYNLLLVKLFPNGAYFPKNEELFSSSPAGARPRPVTAVIDDEGHYSSTRN